jgi:hypothetical protein
LILLAYSNNKKAPFGAFMKLILDQKTVNILTLKNIPSPGPDNKPAAWGPAPEGVRQVLVVDAHREAPLGFGVRVGKTGRGYYAEKKIRGRTIRFALGDAKTITLEAARDLARKKIAERNYSGQGHRWKRTTKPGESATRCPRMSSANSSRPPMRIGRSIAEGATFFC